MVEWSRLHSTFHAVNKRPSTVSRLLHLLRLGRWTDAASAIGRALRRRKRVPTPQSAHDANTEAPLATVDPAAKSDGTALRVQSPGPKPAADARIAAQPLLTPEFIDSTYSCEAGTRPYKLFVPHAPGTQSRPLVVMLHGCRQNPADFAVGTRMNELAHARGIVVLYPGQVLKANHLNCWNWFRPEEQQRGQGEPAIIAGLTSHVMETHGIDSRRVYIAGLSAGGAMAAALAATYPEIFAAVGVHSGLPHAAAHNFATAMSAMRHGPAARAANRRPSERVPLPTIVFHGEEDTTVHPGNGDEVIAQTRWDAEAFADSQNGNGMEVTRAEVPGGRAYTHTRHFDRNGRCDAEHWLVHGAGHAWSGGSAEGSFTDPLGPDASAQMLRFFLEHPKEEAY